MPIHLTAKEIIFTIELFQLPQRKTVCAGAGIVYFATVFSSSNCFKNLKYSTKGCGFALIFPTRYVSSSTASSALKGTPFPRFNKKSDSAYYLLHKATVPSVMVECGFMSNTEENSNLQKEIYQNKLAYLIMLGLNEYITEEL